MRTLPMGHEEFIRQLLREFPHLREDVEDEIFRGLLHPQMAAFSRYAQDTVDRGDASAARRCFQFAARVLRDARPEVENALNVSFLENLRLTGGEREWALDLLPTALRQAYIDMHKYLDDLFGPKGQG